MIGRDKRGIIVRLYRDTRYEISDYDDYENDCIIV
jgi:hypothetical protein